MEVQYLMNIKNKLTEWIHKSATNKIIASLSLIILIFFISFFVIKYLSYEEISLTSTCESPNSSKSTGNSNCSQNTGSKLEEPKIQVYVVGCVKNPGVVTLKKGQIVNDAIILAGGFTKDADIENINLVYILNQNVMLKVKSKSEHSMQSSHSHDNLSSLQIIEELSSDSCYKSNTDSCSSSFRININSASKEQLDQLPGIGEATANAILTYRQNNGFFKVKEDLINVPGIGESKFKKIADLITVD